MIFIDIYILAIFILLTTFFIKPVKKNILTLSFLPSSLEMFNGNPNSRTLKVKGLEITLNYFFAALINLIDFALLFISWIPGLKNILDFMYRNPDIIEKQISFLFGGSKGHRNFITHSVFNPVFLIYIFISSKLCVIFSLTPLNTILRPLLFLIGLCFVCHLLCDTMPKHWKGFANIKVYFFTHLMSFSPITSKAWLYIGSFLSFSLLCEMIIFV